MRKFLYYAIMPFIACSVFVACGDDDDNGKKNQLSEISDNQAMFGGQKLAIVANLNIRPANPSYNDLGAYYLGVSTKDTVKGDTVSMRFDIGAPIVGSSVDLANPIAIVGKNQLSIGFNYVSSYDNIFALEMHDGDYSSSIQEVQYENASCFSEGALTLAHAEKTGFTLSMWGTLKNGEKFAFKVAIPEREINYWENGD